MDWRGYHRVSPVDNLPWRCSRRHGTSQPVPATLTRRLRHINHTSRGARKTARPRQLSKDHLPCRWSGGFSSRWWSLFSARDTTSCSYGCQAQSPRISRFFSCQLTILWRHWPMSSWTPNPAPTTLVVYMWRVCFEACYLYSVTMWRDLTCRVLCGPFHTLSMANW